MKKFSLSYSGWSQARKYPFTFFSLISIESNEQSEQIGQCTNVTENSLIFRTKRVRALLPNFGRFVRFEQQTGSNEVNLNSSVFFKFRYLINIKIILRQSIDGIIKYKYFKENWTFFLRSIFFYSFLWNFHVYEKISTFYEKLRGFYCVEKHVG